MHLIPDNAAGLLMYQNKVCSPRPCFLVSAELYAHAQIDVVLFGADRVAANGDVANKVGTYKIVRFRPSNSCDS